MLYSIRGVVWVGALLFCVLPGSSRGAGTVRKNSFSTRCEIDKIVKINHDTRIELSVVEKIGIKNDPVGAATLRLVKHKNSNEYQMRLTLSGQLRAGVAFIAPMPG
jgi:hypothetical protein